LLIRSILRASCEGREDGDFLSSTASSSVGQNGENDDFGKGGEKLAAHEGTPSLSIMARRKGGFQEERRRRFAVHLDQREAEDRSRLPVIHLRRRRRRGKTPGSSQACLSQAMKRRGGKSSENDYVPTSGAAGEHGPTFLALGRSGWRGRAGARSLRF